MNIGRYLPSAQFTLLVGSLAASVGLVYAAQLVTHSSTAQIQVASNNDAQNNTNWEAAFDAIEAAQASSTLITPSPATVGDMLAAAQSANLTESVGRSLLVNLGDETSQGLGGDIPTQDALVAQAAAQIASTAATTTLYSAADLTIIPTTAASLHDYGNAVMQALAAYPDASEQATFLSIDAAVEGKDAQQKSVLEHIGTSYQDAAQALLKVAVPQTLAPLHLQLINNLLQTGATFSDMSTVTTDSLRGLQGLQNYESYMDAGARVFTQIAENLKNNDILFSKDEPGNAWAGFLSASQ